MEIRYPKSAHITTNTQNLTAPTLHFKSSNWLPPVNNRLFTIVPFAGILLLAMLGLIFTSLSYLTYVYDPLELIIPKIIAFYPNSTSFNLWKEPPYDIYVKVYIFNVSNPGPFLAGEEKLRFNEVGPYVYKEVLYNIDSTFHDNGTMSFTPRRMIEFVRDKSIGDPAVDTLIFPNIPLLGITASIKDESMFINLAVTSLTSYLGSTPFINLTVHDYLYGYDDTLVTLANTYIPNWIDFPRFGILDRLMALDNGSSIVTLNVNPKLKMSTNELLTEKERLQQFSIQKWNGSPGLSQWGYEEPEGNETVPGNSKCNLVEGAFMGTIFPHNIEKNTSFRLYRHAFCRTIPIIYESSGFSKHGFEAYNYRVQQDFLAKPEENSENNCYCNGDNCISKGLGDISPCYYKIPIALSQPHFLNGDPELIEQIDGIFPDKEKHDLTMTVHPGMGLPLEAKLRIQINLVMPETHYNTKTKPFNNLVLPLFWVELAVDDIPSNVKLYITLLYHVLPVVQQVIMFTLGIIGIGLVFGSALATVIPSKSRHKSERSLNVNYSEIPIFPLKTKLFKPVILIKK